MHRIDRNDRYSLGLDSLSSSVAPPCYTSQKGICSSTSPSVAGYDVNDHGDQLSVSMHSCPEASPVNSLPSPYSTEDLLEGLDSSKQHAQPIVLSSTHTPSCAHGYTHTHSQCTIDSPPPPATPATLIRSRILSSPYSFQDQTPNTRYSTGGCPERVPRLQTNLSPRTTLYYHRPLSQPAAIGHVPHRLKASYQLSPDISDQPADINEDAEPFVQSSTTFLPDGVDSYPSHAQSPNIIHPHPRRRTLSTPAPPTRLSPPPPIPPLHLRGFQSHATNYVTLSRKSTFQKTSLFHHNRDLSSSITGKFTIDPDLYIPPSLLRAVEPRSPATAADDHRRLLLKGAISPSSETSCKPKGCVGAYKIGSKITKKNLILEVENGGIDVDVFLVPSNNNSQPPRASVGEDVFGLVNLAPSPVRMSYNSNRLDDSVIRNAGRKQSANIRQSDNIAQTRMKIRPTLIDLRVKETRIRALRSTGIRKVKDFALVARIHAPTPRPPFHLLASTIEMPSLNPSGISDSSKDTGNVLRRPPTTPASQMPNNPQNGPKLSSFSPTKTSYPRSLSISRFVSLSKSDLSLHIPRTFRGPLTMHIAAGNIDTHVRLSREMTNALVVLTESAFSRGYFIGGLSSLAQERDGVEDAWVVVDEDEGKQVEAGPYHFDLAFENKYEIDYAFETGSVEGQPRGDEEDGDNDVGEDPEGTHKFERSGRTRSRSDAADRSEGIKQQVEWLGDKVDVVVGDGKVYLQFLGEEDPFGKKGRLWSKFAFRRKP